MSPVDPASCAESFANMSGNGNSCSSTAVVNSTASPAAFAAESTEVLLFYCYETLGSERASELAQNQRTLGAQLGLCGRVLVASEGINGTVQGTSESTADYQRAVEHFFGSNNGGPTIDWKRSSGGSDPLFPDFAVKEVPELVSFGLHGRARAGGACIRPLDVQAETGLHLPPKSFHKLLEETSDDKLWLLDVRNSFEYEVGHFDRAIDPGMSHTAQWAKYVDDHLEDLRGRRVMMYCTGGIRCEKASAYLRRRLDETTKPATLEEGVDMFDDKKLQEAAGPPATEIYQLQGGIHRYLEAFPDGGLFKGANFVFDKRAQMKGEEAAETGDDRIAVGRCSECASPWERHHGGRVCCVCRVLVLVCDTCDAASPHGEYYCSEHTSMRGLYYHFLKRFNAAELRQQLEGLQSMLKKEIGPKRKNRRNTLRRKIVEIEERLDELNKVGDDRQDEQDTIRRCRACAKPYSDCPGACWGFWKE